MGDWHEGRGTLEALAGYLENGVRPRFLGLVAVVATVAVVALGVGSARASQSTSIAPTIYFAYSMDCTFSIVDDSGKPVTSIAPGNYQVDVTTPVAFGTIPKTFSDMTACRGMAQFQLSGPGVSFFTTLTAGCEAEYVTTQTFLPSSTYTAVDQNQPSVAHASFTTLATGTPTKVSATYGGTATGKGTVSTDIVGSGLPTLSRHARREAQRGWDPDTPAEREGRHEARRRALPLPDHRSGQAAQLQHSRAQDARDEESHRRRVRRPSLHTAVIALTPGRWTFMAGLSQIRTFVVS